MSEGIIYGIRKLTEQKFCYVGQTRQSLARRWNHYKRTRTPIAKFIRENGGTDNFQIVVLETVAVDKLDEREIALIAEHNTLAPNGYNQLPGGRVSLHTEATKAKISASAKGKRRSIEARENLSAGKRRYWADPENRAKQEAGIVKRWSVEANRKAQGESVKRRLQDPTAREKQQVARLKALAIWRGQKHTEETLAKIAAAQRARWAKRKQEA